MGRYHSYFTNCHLLTKDHIPSGEDGGEILKSLYFITEVWMKIWGGPLDQAGPLDEHIPLGEAICVFV